MADNSKKKLAGSPSFLPVITIENDIVFPYSNKTIPVSNAQVLKSLTEALEQGKQFILLTQKDGTKGDDPVRNLYSVGVLCDIFGYRNIDNKSIELDISSGARVEVRQFKQGKFLAAEFTEIPDQRKDSKEMSGLVRVACRKFKDYINAGIEEEQYLLSSLEKVKGNLEAQGSLIASCLEDLSFAEKRDLLEETDPAARFEKLITLLIREIDNRNTDLDIEEQAQDRIEKDQRKFYLENELKIIREELGLDKTGDEIDAYKERITQINLSPEAREKASKEVARLESMEPGFPQADIIRTYLDTLLGLPWNKCGKINHDITHARKVLDQDHYGMDTVKEQIIKTLTVQKRLAEQKSENSVSPQILCLVGPPGIGKTSLGKSIAEATGRKLFRMALGGVRDEAEIRGHRVTYIGAQMGKLLSGLAKTGENNPVILLDEIDKLSSDSRGDPASALLEVLDPAQNHSFMDHYLGVGYDLSRVLFIATANVQAGIPLPLQDRMEMIHLESYTPDEKMEIARRHLVPGQRQAHGLDEKEFSITDEALHQLIDHYTGESGVRTLEREIGKLCDNAVTALNGTCKTVAITVENLEKYAGKYKFTHDLAEEEDQIGVVTGLAYTDIGGATLPIEAVLLPRENVPIILTGNLGDVMKESMRVALTVAKKKAGELGYQNSLAKLERSTLHLHVPEGAIPKDGPSAGVGMLTTLFSIITGKPVRKDIAMTGEIRLTGKVTPIGGLREKLSAAARSGYKTVLIPEQNIKNLDEVPAQVKNALEIIPVKTIDQVLENAFIGGKDLKAPESEVIHHDKSLIVPAEKQAHLQSGSPSTM